MNASTSDGVSDALMDAAFSPDDKKSFDAYKRAVYRRPPPYFSVYSLPATKHGGAYSYGLRICPHTSDFDSPKSPVTEYEIWRRWEDCLYLQETLETEYQALLGVENATNASQFSFGSGSSASSVTVVSAFSPTTLPHDAADDVHAYLPRLTKKGTLFRPSAATIDQREREFRALTEALFHPPDYAPVGVLRRVRAVHDFFGFWRRDHDRAQKYGGATPMTTETVHPPKLTFTKSAPTTLSRSYNEHPIPVSPLTPNSGETVWSLPGHPAPRVKDLVTPPEPAPAPKRSMKDLSRSTPFLSFGAPPPPPPRATIRSPISSPIPSTARAPSAPPVSIFRPRNRAREEAPGVQPVPLPGSLEAKIVSDVSLWQPFLAKPTTRSGLPLPPSRTPRTVAISAPIVRAPSPVPSVISLSTSIFSEESDETEYADGNGVLDDTSDVNPRKSYERITSSTGTFGRTPNGQRHVSLSSDISMQGESSGSGSRPDSTLSDMSSAEINTAAFTDVRQRRPSDGHIAPAAPPRVVWLAPRSAGLESESGMSGHARRRSGGDKGAPPSAAKPTLEQLLDTDVRQRWWHTHTNVVGGQAPPSHVTTESTRTRGLGSTHTTVDVQAWALGVPPMSHAS